jgi:hypothetical protein
MELPKELFFSVDNTEIAGCILGNALFPPYQENYFGINALFR